MKTIIDPVHGAITFPNYVIEIINTAEFQRLKHLKQLGVATYVFPGATHSRYEHCLGVCYLAGKLLDILEKNSGIEIMPMLRKCVMLAGLLHDIGHGPFSHFWEHFVHIGEDKNWTHEDSSCKMTDHLFKKNKILLSSDPVEHFYCLELIKALIVGDEQHYADLLLPNHFFLTEIVNNKFCFIDVDKWDYLLRDRYYLNNTVDNFHEDFQQFFFGARVTADTDRITHISYHVNDHNHIYELFENRSNLHIHCYQHNTILGLEQLILDALIIAENSGFTFKGVKLSKAQQYNDVYTHLNDTIVNILSASEDPNLFKAREMLKRVYERKIYKKVWTGDSEIDIKKLNEQMGKHFVQKHKKIPFAGQIMPKNIMLHNDNGNITEPLVTFGGGFYEEYIVFCTSPSLDVVKNAKKYLEQNHRTLVKSS